MSRSTDVDDVPYIKIALIGDSGVGKTTLVGVLATGCFESSPIYRPTYGCAIEILQNTHELQGKYFIELWDLGGNPRYKDGRPLCYDDCDGYIFLWDSSSEITYHSLQTWLAEVTQARCRNLASNNWRTHDEEESTTHEEGGYDQQPLLIVGNKIDKLSNAEREALQMANEQQIFVSSRSSDNFDSKAFFHFFNEVYDKGRCKQHLQQEKKEERRSPQTVLASPLKNNSNCSSSNDDDINVTQSIPSHTTPVKKRDHSPPSTPILTTEEVLESTWTSPLRGFTSSLFSLSSSASSLRRRGGIEGAAHTIDHTHTLEKV